MENEESKVVVDLEQLVPRITEEVAAELRNRTVEALTYSVGEVVKAEVKTYIQEHILPTVRKELEAHDAEIRAALVGGITGAATKMAEAIEARAAKKIANYEGDKVIRTMIDALFGRY